jgi:hypothetical protein
VETERRIQVPISFWVQEPAGPRIDWDSAICPKDHANLQIR